MSMLLVVESVVPSCQGGSIWILWNRYKNCCLENLLIPLMWYYAVASY